jgi:hypothetical protein
MDVIFLGLASMARLDTMYPNSFPFGTPKVHFFRIQFDAEPSEVSKRGV